MGSDCKCCPAIYCALYVEFVDWKFDPRLPLIDERTTEYDCACVIMTPNKQNMNHLDFENKVITFNYISIQYK